MCSCSNRSDGIWQCICAGEGCSLVSLLLGAGKKEDIKRVSSHCIYTGYLRGLVLGIFFLLTGQMLLPLLGADGDTILMLHLQVVTMTELTSNISGINQKRKRKDGGN